MPHYAIAGRRPTVHPSAWIAPDADLIGSAVIGEDASLWFGAVIRADNTEIAVGARSNVQEGALLHSDAGTPCTVGNDCTVGHRAILHGCTVHDRVLIGMGAIVLNGAEIGAESIVGAGALVTEGKRFPPRSLIVGSPARVIRTLDDTVTLTLRLSAAHYVEKARSYAAGLARVD